MAEKSLDDQLKEAQIAKHKAETAKLKAEADLARKQVNAKWYAGKKLAAMATGVLTAVALYGVLDGIFFAPVRKQNQTVEQARERLANINARLLDARIDSLNRKQAKISTTIDSLRIRATISAIFGNLDSLKYANVLKHYNIITANNYYERNLNPDGRGRENEFDVRDVEGDTVIYDAATKLTWQGGSEFPPMRWTKATAYVDTLSYAGGGWRLPTLEEAMSLMEPEKVAHGATQQDSLYIDAHFKGARYIWTSDKYTASRAWYVYFSNGYCSHIDVDGIFDSFVRAVR